MSRQNLRDREIDIALEELGGKQTTRGFRDYFKRRGLIVTNDDTIEEWELDQTRRMIQESRKRRSKSEVQQEWINLTETTEDGEKVQYYKKFGELTAEEGVRLLEYWNKAGRYADKQFHRYYKPLMKQHGRKFQRMIPFPIPLPPTPLEPA